MLEVYRLAFKVGIALLILTAYSGALVGYGHGRAKAEYARQEKKNLEAVLAHRDALQAQIDTMAHENAKLVFELKNRKPEVKKHATNAQRSDACNPTLGAVSVLNVQKGYPVGSPDNPRLPAGKDAAPSTVTGERILEELESCEIDYRIAVTRLNGLIDSCSVLQ